MSSEKGLVVHISFTFLCFILYVIILFVTSDSSWFLEIIKAITRIINVITKILIIKLIPLFWAKDLFNGFKSQCLILFLLEIPRSLEGKYFNVNSYYH